MDSHLGHVGFKMLSSVLLWAVGGGSSPAVSKGSASASSSPGWPVSKNEAWPGHLLAGERPSGGTCVQRQAAQAPEEHQAYLEPAHIFHGPTLPSH